MTILLWKFLRYIRLYGFRRTIIKAIGRHRYWCYRLPVLPKWHRQKPFIGVIGCGQFAFSTLCYYLQKQNHGSIAGCYDLVEEQAKTLSHFYQIPKVFSSAQALIQDPNIELVFIASNHSSHTPYAVEAIKHGKSVYIEKPIATTLEQYQQLIQTNLLYQGKIVTGYNRPFAPAIQTLRQYMKGQDKPLTLTATIFCHLIPPNHWYRMPEEGTRICGNLGHWLDLAIHLLSLKPFPPIFHIQITYSNPAQPDDNIAVTITTNCQDLICLIISAREEPFEGITEYIQLQQGDLLCHIRDFRTLHLWHGTHYIKKHYRPKNIGHCNTVRQVLGRVSRDFKEVELSTLLMLHVTEMVRQGQEASTLNLLAHWEEQKRICEEAIASSSAVQ